MCMRQDPPKSRRTITSTDFTAGGRTATPPAGPGCSIRFAEAVPFRLKGQSSLTF
jgi:hypothetical protein